MKEKTKKIVRYLSIAVAVASLIFGVVFFVAFEKVIRSIATANLEDIPEGWTDRIRNQSTPPAVLSTLLPAERLDGNAAEFVDRYASGLGDDEVYASALRKLRDEEPFSAADSAAWDSVLADSTVEFLARSASFTDYRIYHLVLARPENEGASTIISVIHPEYWRLSVGARALAFRARRKLAEGDTAAAVRDIRSVFALGNHMMRADPFLEGWASGRIVVKLAAEEAETIATVNGDPDLAAAAAEILHWIEESGGMGHFFEAMVALPDSAVQLAGEESLATVWRSEALAALMITQYRPYRIWGGTQNEIREVVTSFVDDVDPQIAGRAAFILGTMDSWDEMGVFGRWKFLWNVVGS
ncbi:MAG: hypothetical protein O7D29_12500 [Gemmatimonadetes bacterium]|nr:hypothetical protein [Gemmatimonadota bacterium]